MTLACLSFIVIIHSGLFAPSLIVSACPCLEGGVLLGPRWDCCLLAGCYAWLPSCVWADGGLRRGIGVLALRLMVFLCTFVRGSHFFCPDARTCTFRHWPRPTLSARLLDFRPRWPSRDLCRASATLRCHLVDGGHVERTGAESL